MFQIATIAVLTAIASLPSPAPTTRSINDESLSQMMERGARTRLRARFGDKDAAQAAADYREIQVGSGVVIRFSLEIEDAQPNTTYEVALNGVVFAEVTTNGLGGADLNLKTLTDDSGGNSSIPMMVAGDEISVAGVGVGALEVH